MQNSSFHKYKPKYSFFHEAQWSNLNFQALQVRIADSVLKFQDKKMLWTVNGQKTRLARNFARIRNPFQWIHD